MRKRYMKFRLGIIQLLAVMLVLVLAAKNKKSSRNKHKVYKTTTPSYPTKKMCVNTATTIRARHKSCLLRADTGPCRADIIQWYYDAKQTRCYRFFWGGCQGNGNRFQTKEECFDYCYLNYTNSPAIIPYFCQQPFDYGTCFGHYNRWAWDRHVKTCKRRIYSGCGGNQNNFETRGQCQRTCLSPPNNTINSAVSFTTCMPINIEQF